MKNGTTEIPLQDISPYQDETVGRREIKVSFNKCHPPSLNGEKEQSIWINNL